MRKFVKQLKIAIDLRALVDKNIDQNTDSLLQCLAWKGSLGTVTVLSDVFDLYLLVPQCHLTDEEILRWLKAAQINASFRKFISIDENIRDIILSTGISVTITSVKQLALDTQTVSRVYFLQKKHNFTNIQIGIHYVTQWREIIRDISLFSSQ